MSENFKKYFLAANSTLGFVSHFGDTYDPKSGWKAYIIKGGPGTGKSSFMKYIFKKGIDKGFKAELFPCSSDPDSLDAVSFPEKKVIIMDGTAPHIVDPKYPAVSDTILNFGQFWDEEKIIPFSKEIIRVTDSNKRLHKTASLYLQAAGKLMSENYETARSIVNKKRAEVFAERIGNKYLIDKKCDGSEEIRFLAGVTPKGIVFFKKTITEFYKETVIIEDDFGVVTNIVMEKIRELALQRGYNIIKVKNALLPQITDHIIIPELSLSFVRENDFQHLDCKVRRIHARRFSDVKELKNSREKIKFNKKVIKELLLSAIDTLKEAKSVHDELEKYYIDAMDFKALSNFAVEFSKKIFD